MPRQPQRLFHVVGRGGLAGRAEPDRQGPAPLTPLEGLERRVLQAGRQPHEARPRLAGPGDVSGGALPQALAGQLAAGRLGAGPPAGRGSAVDEPALRAGQPDGLGGQVAQPVREQRLVHGLGRDVQMLFKQSYQLVAREGEVAVLPPAGRGSGHPGDLGESLYADSFGKAKKPQHRTRRRRDPVRHRPSSERPFPY